MTADPPRDPPSRTSSDLPADPSAARSTANRGVGPLVVVVGLMATGKSTIAGRLAARLGVPVRDSDDEIEASTHHTVRELSAEEGAAAMHAREARQLLDVLADGRPCVAAAAASVIDDERCRAALLGVDVVWLRARLDTMLARFRAQRHRPTFGLPPEELLSRQIADRSPRFAAVADIVVDVDGRTPDDLADEILRRLPGVGARPDPPG